MMKSLILALLFASLSLQQATKLPVGFLPGLGDFCGNLNPNFIDPIKKYASNPMFCIEVSAGMNIMRPALERQMDSICSELEKHDKKYNLKGGFILLGLSEGGLKARVAVEVCSMGKYIKKVISIGGPQNGVAAVPHTGMDIFSNMINKVSDEFAYSKLVQGLLEPANYFHRIDDESKFIHSGIPLAKYNNVLKNNAAIKEKISALDALVLIMFSKDTMIEPKETAHFGFYKDHTKKEIVAMKDSVMYSEDWIGLKALDAAGKIHFHEFEGEHLQISMAEIKSIVIPYFQ
jgi:palmitoyl-protein thioesterase